MILVSLCCLGSLGWRARYLRGYLRVVPDYLVKERQVLALSARHAYLTVGAPGFSRETQLNILQTVVSSPHIVRSAWPTLASRLAQEN